MWRLDDEVRLPGAASGENNVARAAVLAVGDTAEWLRRKQPVPPGGRIVLASFGDISAELLDRLQPHLVVSPLLAREFDCIDLAVLLHRSGYRGQYRVISDDLPDPRVVLAEVRHLCPRLDFGIIGTEILRNPG